MVRLAPIVLPSLIGLAAMATGHPGHDVKAEAAKRAAFLRHALIHSRSLSHCFTKLKAKGLEAENITRRDATVQ